MSESTIPQNKTCTKCHVEQPIENFYKAAGYTGGHRTWCKKCVALWHVADVKKKPDMYAKRDKDLATESSRAKKGDQHRIPQ